MDMLDIAHISFLDMIKVMITLTGAASAKGTLVRNALKTAERIAEVDYPTFEAYLAAVESASSPITLIEGRAEHQGSHVFGLRVCPFAASIRSYSAVFEKLPDGFADFTAEFNRPSHVTDQDRVGAGAGVSPFCSVHQPMRSAFAEKIRIGGKKLRIYQLGCKSAGGKKGLADRWIAEAGVAREVVERILDGHVCCYAVKVLE